MQSKINYNNSTAMKKLFLFISTTLLSLSLSAQTLVNGGQFKDRILPMQGSQVASDGQIIWGAQEVQGRFLDNGAEPQTSNGKPTLSYWGGNIVKATDGTFHLYLAGWDATQRAHSYWPNSDVYHLTSTSPSGPFSLTANYNIGQGHNPTVFQAADGTYVLYVLMGNTAAYRYKSSTLGDSWSSKELMPSNLRDRALSTGTAQAYSNWTFAKRSDGSIYCMDRGGAMWISETGLSDFEEVNDKSAYPGGYQRYYEDPVVWKDEFQYHMIVNHWNDKIANYSRSKDGFHWISETGTAYDPTVAVHADGTKEKWVKFERPRVYQDEYGRATHLNMAVIDSEKSDDRAGDIHSSKNIVMPLNPGMRMEVLNQEKISTSTTSINVKIYKEEGFNPAADLNIGSLRFGSHGTVNTGGGASVVSHNTDSDGNLILTFNGAASGLTADEFAPKIIGKYINDNMCYGYARLSYIDYEPAYLSPVLPVIDSESKLSSVNVKNYGLKASTATTVKVLAADGTTVLSTGTVPALEKYASADVALNASVAIPAASTTLKVAFYDNNGTKTDEHTLQLTNALAAQKKLATAISEAEELAGKASYHYGKDELRAAITVAKSHKNSFHTPTLEEQSDNLEKAINTFKFANATNNNPVSITIENADMSSLEGWEILNTESNGFHINSSNNHDYNAIGRNPFMEAYNSRSITSPNYAQQTFKDMPEGKYVFSADVIAQKGNGGCTGIEIFANNEKTACSSSQSNHSEKYSVELTLTEPADVTIGLKVLSGSNATWVGFDNAELKYYGDGSHTGDELFYKASIENVYIKGNGQSKNHYVTVEPNYDNYLNRYTDPDENSVWSKIVDEETNDIWLYNKATQSFIIPSGDHWQTSTTTAQKTLAIESSGTGFQIKCLESGGKIYLNAYGGFSTSRTIGSSSLIGFPVGGYTSGVWDMPLANDQTMPSFTLANITTGVDVLKKTLAKLPKAAVIEVKEYGWATFCAPFDVTIPSGLKAYTAEINDEKDALILTEVPNTISANTAVMLYAEGGFGPYYVCGETEATQATVVTGALVGVLSAECKVSAGGYVLQNQPSGAGFYKTTTEMNATKNKCFVTIANSFAAKSLKLIFKDDATAIPIVHSASNTDNASFCNMAGQHVGKNYKGIVVIKGKKILK